MLFWYVQQHLTIGHRLYFAYRNDTLSLKMWSRHVINAAVLWYTLTNWIFNDISTLYLIAVCFWFLDISTFMWSYRCLLLRVDCKPPSCFYKWACCIHLTLKPDISHLITLRFGLIKCCMHHISFWDGDMHYFMLLKKTFLLHLFIHFDVFYIICFENVHREEIMLKYKIY